PGLHARQQPGIRVWKQTDAAAIYCGRLSTEQSEFANPVGQLPDSLRRAVEAVRFGANLISSAQRETPGDGSGFRDGTGAAGFDSGDRKKLLRRAGDEGERKGRGRSREDSGSERTTHGDDAQGRDAGGFGLAQREGFCFADAGSPDPCAKRSGTGGDAVGAWNGSGLGCASGACGIFGGARYANENDTGMDSDRIGGAPRTARSSIAGDGNGR